MVSAFNILESAPHLPDRAGCMTCKKKRLKCDETKPTCSQCSKRNVVCEGYKKDYKWRSFEETSFNPRPIPKSKKSERSVSFTQSHAQPKSVPNNGPSVHHGPKPPSSWSPGLNSAFADAAHAFRGATGVLSKADELKTTPPLLTPGPLDPNPLNYGNGFHGNGFPDAFDPYSLPNPTRTSSRNDDGSGQSSGSTFSSGSPQLLDLLLPGTDLRRPPDASEMRPPMSPLPYQPGLDSPGAFDTSIHMDEDFDEEIVRERSPFDDPTLSRDAGNWQLRQASPTPSDTSSSSSRSSNTTILAQPHLDASSAEMIMMRFDRETCGILSIKDGPTENPWRTLVWPLAQDSPALYHAISSMTAFHGAQENPALRMSGMAHMTKSIKKLAFEIENMRLDAALATSLALAFSEGWDRHVSTGIQHLRGAKVMVNNAVVKHRRDTQNNQMTVEDGLRLKFLCNTFVYMDVIARLSSLTESTGFNFDEILGTVNQPLGDLVEVDPLMGCAVTLFPLVGRVATLIQKVRKTNSNSVQTVSDAMELQEKLRQWQVPSPMIFERPEDESSDVQHSIRTAEAYRYATLLYLHQAVPEIPSYPSDGLAKKVLMTLASVPLSSRAIIVQIYPLLAAGCEVTALEDRQWVQHRWSAMISRLKIGNVSLCWEITQEVWSRRDGFEAEKADRLMRRYTARGVPNGNVTPPRLNSGKRKAQSTEAGSEEVFFGGFGDGIDQDRRPMKRRVTSDAATGMSTLPPIPGLTRGLGEQVTDLLETEYTVRGGLHWLGVMQDRDWEGKSSTIVACGYATDDITYSVSWMMTIYLTSCPLVDYATSTAALSNRTPESLHRLCCFWVSCCWSGTASYCWCTHPARWIWKA